MRCKFMYQHDESDCGAASLAMVASYFGLDIPIAKWREYTNTDKQGVSIYGIIEGAEAVGLHAQGLAGTLDELLDGIENKIVSFPFIAHIINGKKQGHFIVIQKYSNNKFNILDPEIGRRKISIERFLEVWTGNIITFEKKDNFQKKNETKGTFIRYFRLLKGQYHKLITAFVLSLIVAFLGIMSAFIFQAIVDNFGVTSGEYVYEETENCEDENCEDHDHDDTENIFEQILDKIYIKAQNYNAFFIGAIILFFVQYAIQYFRSWLMLHVSKQLDIRLSMDYFADVIHLPMKSANRRKTGEYLTRFADATLVKEAVSNVTVTVMLDSLMVIACGIILYFENSTMFFVALCVMTSYAFLVIIFQRPLEKMNRRCLNKNAEMESYVKESFDGIETIKACGTENLVIKNAKQHFGELTSLEMKEGLIAVGQDILSSLVESIGHICIIWIGFSLVLKGDITFGSLLSFYIILGYFTSPIKSMIQLQPTMLTAVVAADRLNDIMDMDLEDYSEKEAFCSNWKEITLNNVVFQYGNREPILKNIDLCIKRGQHIAIVGESGSGKTSLAKMLVGLYHPDNGQILMDGKSVNQYSLSSLRNEFAYLRQDPFLFADTVKNNLTMGKNHPDTKIEEVCKKCKINDMIQELPFQFDSLLSEMAKNVSSGQKQRLALARALLRNPSMLILDEATSNVDLNTEAEIYRNILSDKKITVIVIAHRLESIKECDNIIVMEKGEIREQGSHEELLNHKSTYFEMWSKQCR